MLMGMIGDGTSVTAASEDASTTAWVNAVIAAGGTVSSSQRSGVNTLITSLKSHGLWTVQDRVWLLASESSFQSLIDIVNLGAATVVGTGGTFTAKQGYSASSSANYINSQYVPTVNAVNYTRNDGSISAYVRTNRTTNTTGGAALGIFDPAVTGAQSILVTNSLLTLTWDINNAQFSNQAATTTSRGCYTTARVSSVARSVYVNSNSTTFATDTQGSLAITNLSFPFFIMARNNSSSPDLPCADEVAIVAISGSMTSAANVSQFQTDLNAYMTYLGTNVY